MGARARRPTGSRGARAQHAPAYRQMCRRLCRWRTDAGLTQRALAAKLAKPHSYVWKVEAGERRIDPVEFAAWAKACGLRPAAAMEQLNL